MGIALALNSITYFSPCDVISVAESELAGPDNLVGTRTGKKNSGSGSGFYDYLGKENRKIGVKNRWKSTLIRKSKLNI